MMHFGRQTRKKWQKATLGKLESKGDILLRQQKFSNALTRTLIVIAFCLFLLLLILERWLRHPQAVILSMPTAAYTLLLMLVGVLGWVGLTRIFPQAVSAVASFYRLMGLLLIYFLVTKAILLLGIPRFFAPLPLLAMAVTVMHSESVAAYITAGVALVTAFMSGVDLHMTAAPFLGVAGADGALVYPALDVPLMLVLFLGGLATVIGPGRLRSQSRPVTIGFMTGLVHGAVILACSFLEAAPLDTAADPAAPVLAHAVFDALCGFANGLICGVVITSIMPALERFFDVVTERRLRELADLSSELLRTFALRAPGSFTHSQNVAHLASEAAAAVGADPLLARVGGYYHDIGKLFKPEYFVENQTGSVNPHDRLSPEMSRLVIVSHVKDGLGIAEEEGLPPKVAAMIPMHHGTTVVSFFYQRAKDQADAGGRYDTDMESYRYPGPRPTFKEAGILMLADVVEAASRACTEPTASRLKTLVHDIVLRRLREGELDDSDLTLRDLSRIEESFLRTLSTQIFHGRIPYPKEGDQDRNGEHGTR